VRVFNCGIGMVLIVAPERADEAARMLAAAGETVARIGTVVPRASADAPGCVVENLASWGVAGA
jgi:phosphoribosylformylglycinamidine cyclo-ligase